MQKVQTPLNRLLEDRRHLANQPVESPVGSSAERRTLGTDAERQDLGRVEPGDRAPGRSEGAVVNHDEDDDQAWRPIRDIEVDKIRNGR